eukprot:5056633-Amphidinium_carterae.1
MGDAGLCIGAAYLAAQDLGLRVEEPAGEGIFLGPSFSGELVQTAVQAAGLAARSCVNIEEYAALVASEIDAGQVVGLFYGAMEFGPRALGHRSLLSRATDPSACAALSARLQRTDFMPFAPATLRSHAREAYEGIGDAGDDAGRHMTTCWRATAHLREVCPAIVHEDGTARPQLVDERDGLYFAILHAYHTLTGLHTLINTSFNMHEEPI